MIPRRPLGAIRLLWEGPLSPSPISFFFVAPKTLQHLKKTKVQAPVSVGATQASVHGHPFRVKGSACWVTSEPSPIAWGPEGIGQKKRPKMGVRFTTKLWCSQKVYPPTNMEVHKPLSKRKVILPKKSVQFHVRRWEGLTPNSGSEATPPTEAAAKSSKFDMSLGS